MKVKNFIPMLALLFFGACNTSNKPENELTGVWAMHKVYEFGKDETEKHNPKNNRWIEFRQDGTFVSDGDPGGRNTGRWRMDEEKAILYLDSDMEGDDSEWKVSFDGNKTTLTGTSETLAPVHKGFFATPIWFRRLAWTLINSGVQGGVNLDLSTFLTFRKLLP